MAANLKILKDIFKEHEINRRTIVFFLSNMPLTTWRRG